MIELITIYLEFDEENFLSIEIDLTDKSHKITDWNLTPPASAEVLEIIDFYKTYSKWYTKVIKETEEMIEKLC